MASTGWQWGPRALSVSSLAAGYAATGDFGSVAKAHGIPRPAVRKLIREAASALDGRKGLEEKALAAHLRYLVYQVAASGTGLPARQERKLRRLAVQRHTDPDILGRWSADMADPDFGCLFAASAGRQKGTHASLHR